MWIKIPRFWNNMLEKMSSGVFWNLLGWSSLSFKCQPRKRIIRHFLKFRNNLTNREMDPHDRTLVVNCVSQTHGKPDHNFLIYWKRGKKNPDIMAMFKQNVSCEKINIHKYQSSIRCNEKKGRVMYHKTT